MGRYLSLVSSPMYLFLIKRLKRKRGYEERERRRYRREGERREGDTKSKREQVVASESSVIISSEDIHFLLVYYRRVSISVLIKLINEK